MDLIDLVRDSCLTHAARIAVRAEDGERTFAQVWERAQSVSAALRLSGVRQGDFVGLWALKSADLLSGVLGILSAGAGYIPLDVSLPAERLDYIAHDAGFRVVVSIAAGASDAARFGLPVVVVDSGEPAHGDAPPAVDPDGPAYIIYTSGSTGRPRGVVVERRSVVNLLLGMQDDLRSRPGDVFVGTAPLCFDASVPNLLLPVVTGGTLCLPPPGVAVDPHAIAALVEDVGATVLKCSNSVLRMLCAIDWPGRQDLKLVTGGEALPPAVAQMLLPRVAELWNYYGPTETTISSMRARLVEGDTDPVPIGHPMPGVGHRVLDEDRSPVEAGAVGELWISGTGVARGYLHDERTTADRFVDLDDGRGGTVRTYRTGDLVREREDGSLVLIGRTDDQIKLHGYRIELNEIEARLAEHPDVLQAVAVVNRTVGDGRVVAFVHASTPEVDVDQLRTFAARLLPAYMVPTAIVLVAGYPLTVGGKIDRRTLSEALVAPRAEPGSFDMVEQQQVAEVMSAVVGVPLGELGPTTDFFALGGQSILAVELFAGIRRAMGVRLPLSTLITAATVAGLADAVIAARQGEIPGPLVRLREGVGAPLFCVHDGTGDLLSFRSLVAALATPHPVYGLRMVGVDRSRPFQHDLDDIVTTYLSAVREVCPDGPYRFAGYSVGGQIAYLMAARLAADGQPTELVVLLDTPAPRKVMAAIGRTQRSSAGRAEGWAGHRHLLRIRARDGINLLRYRLWRLVALPGWVDRDRVLPDVLHVPERVLVHVVAAYPRFPAYDGRVVQWWGDHEGNVRPDQMVEAWNSLVRPGIEALVICGPAVSHVDFLQGETGRWVAEGLAAELERADGDDVVRPEMALSPAFRSSGDEARPSAHALSILLGSAALSVVADD